MCPGEVMRDGAPCQSAQAWRLAWLFHLVPLHNGRVVAHGLGSSGKWW